MIRTAGLALLALALMTPALLGQEKPGSLPFVVTGEKGVPGSGAEVGARVVLAELEGREGEGFGT